MFPGMGKIDQRKMQTVMKQMGINQVEIPADKVIIEKADGRIVIENPNVQKISMGGQESWQVTGEAREETGISDEDLKLVMDKTGASREDAKRALEESGGDIAEAILKLS